MTKAEMQVQTKPTGSIGSPELELGKWLILVTGAIAAVVLNALSGAADHPHLAAMLIRWFAALPLLVFGIFYAGLVFFRRYKLPYQSENETRPAWLIEAADRVISKTPRPIKSMLLWMAETYQLLLMLTVICFSMLAGGWLLVDGFLLFVEVNSLLYQQQIDDLTH